MAAFDPTQTAGAPGRENARMQIQFKERPSSGSRVVDLLSHAPLFRGMSPEEVGRIALGTREVRAAKGEALFRRGDPCEGFHIVAFGQVKLALTTPAGEEKVVEIIGPGHSFGEAVMFMDRPYLVSATALTDSLLLHVAKSTLYAELDRDPGLARRMLGSLSMRLHMLVKDMESFTLHSAAQRVIGFLTRLEDEAQASRITLPAQKSLVASRLNLTPEYFSRILHELSDAGLVKVEGREIEILDPEGLRRFGQS
jgi:CRP/FNR family transcriptional regulator, dissimilatory nitrate respiration regulator